MDVRFLTEVPGEVCLGRNSNQLLITLILTELLPCKEKEGFVTAVIDFGDPNRTAQQNPVVILFVRRGLVPGIRPILRAV